MPDIPTADDITIHQLEAGAAEWLDQLPYGVIGMTPEGKVDIYNATESKAAGLSRERVLGKDFFAEIGICMNNFMVAQRFEDEPILDATLAYVLTLRMRPTPVTLRLLQQPGTARSYILVRR